MRLGVLGGSFNPVHKGHIHLAETAISELKLDRVILIPAYQSPFKLEAESMTNSTANRITMLASAIAGDPRFAIDDCEIKREGVSYTVQTLEDIIMRYMPTEKPYLLIGDDLAADFPKWREYERILEIAKVVIARRYDINGENQYPYPHIKLDNEIINISSTMIRAGDKSSAASLRLPDYCEASSHGRCVNSSSILNLENEARNTLTTTRFLHSRHTALLAYDMCKRFGLDPMDGYLAGIAHDLAKQHDPKEMLKLAKKDGNPINALEKDRPNLLHGRAAAVLLRERFCMHNKDILEAVAVHTGGNDVMSPLAKVIYIADKLEFSRNIDSSLRKMCYEAELDNVLFAVLKKTVSKLQSRELELSEGTLKLLKKFKGKNN